MSKKSKCIHNISLPIGKTTQKIEFDKKRNFKSTCYICGKLLVTDIDNKRKFYD